MATCSLENAAVLGMYESGTAFFNFAWRQWQGLFNLKQLVPQDVNVVRTSWM
jgi:hypothetical protein